MTWLLALVAIYVVVGLVVVSKFGWGDSFSINVKLFFLGGLGWPYVLYDEWHNNRDAGDRGPKIE